MKGSEKERFIAFQITNQDPSFSSSMRCKKLAGSGDEIVVHHVAKSKLVRIIVNLLQ